MIKIATAECFTHGKIGREIHSIAQSYEGEFGASYIENIQNYEKLVKNSDKFNINELSLVCGLFIPTIEGLEKILKVKPPKPYDLIKGIKIYKEEEDKEIAVLMAKSVKKITGADIGIGTSAGIGKGGIAIVTKNIILTASSDIYADLRKIDSGILFKRQESGIIKGLNLLFNILNDNFDYLNKIEDVNFNLY
jgi:uncharacterized protein (UPF0254 family)